MKELFIHVLNISITASFLVLAVIIYRLFAKRAPKWVSVLLWGLVGLRLLFPFSIESDLSLIPSKSTVPPTITQDRYPALDTGFDSVDEIVNSFLAGTMTAPPEQSANPMDILITAVGWIWLGVMLCMLLYMAASFIYLRVRTRVKVECGGGVFLCDYVRTPFILGLFKPGIYLPSNVSDRDRSAVIAHERAHIRRLDHIWKPLGFLLLSVYWFNPLLWVAYALLCRDIESACDERVISGLNGKERAEYSEALLSLGVKSRVISACPLAFGEVSVKMRIGAIARYKKPAAKIIVLCIAICALFAACFLTYKKKDPVAIDQGIWYAGRIIGYTDPEASCDGVPRFVFTEGGDILIESRDLSGPSYVTLGEMHSSYLSRKNYAELLEGVKFRTGYGLEQLYDEVKGVWRITPTVSSGISHGEIYLMISDKDLYMGYSDGGRIATLYELTFNETLPTYLYTMTFVAPDAVNTTLILDTASGVGRLCFGEGINYQTMGTFTYENSRLIFRTRDYFDLKLVFLDLGNGLIYSEKESDTASFDGLLPDGLSFRGHYQLYNASSCTQWFDVNGDGKHEAVFAHINAEGALWYLVHGNGKTIAQKTVPFTNYDNLKLQTEGDRLYLIGEYKENDYGSYRYEVSFDGTELIFTEVKE